MAVTLYSGFRDESTEIRPWSPPGTINSMLTGLRDMLQVAACCRNNLDVTIYPTTAYSTAQTIYMPPVLGTLYNKLQVRVSSTTDISNMYLLSGGGTYTQSYSSATWTDVTATSTKYAVPYVTMVAGATTATRIVFRAIQDPTVGSYGATDLKRLMPGHSSSESVTFDNMAISFPLTDNGGVSPAEYNCMVDAARKCGELPVLQSGVSTISQTQQWVSNWTGITIPVCLDPQGPAAQKVLTLVIYTQDTAITQLRAAFGHGSWTGTLERSFRTNSISEYRLNLTRMLEITQPDFVQCGRQYWYCHIDNFPSQKGSGYIYCWSAWTGVPEGAY